MDTLYCLSTGSGSDSSRPFCSEALSSADRHRFAILCLAPARGLLCEMKRGSVPRRGNCCPLPLTFPLLGRMLSANAGARTLAKGNERKRTTAKAREDDQAISVHSFTFRPDIPARVLSPVTGRPMGPRPGRSGRGLAAFPPSPGRNPPVNAPLRPEYHAPFFGQSCQPASMASAPAGVAFRHQTPASHRGGSVARYSCLLYMRLRVLSRGARAKTDARTLAKGNEGRRTHAKDNEGANRPEASRLRGEEPPPASAAI